MGKQLGHFVKREKRIVGYEFNEIQKEKVKQEEFGEKRNGN